MVARRSGSLLAALACVLILTTGCGLYVDGGLLGPSVVIGPTVGPAYRPAPAYGTPYRRGHDVVRVGLNAGGYSVSDPQVDSGTYIGGMLSFWPHEIFGLELGIGACTMTDTSPLTRGEITVVPATFTAILALPDTQVPFFNWRLGAGMGIASVSHSTQSLSETMPVLTFQAGGKIDFTVGARVFLVGEYMHGSQVNNATDSWDLGAMTGVRVGLQFGF